MRGGSWAGVQAKTGARLNKVSSASSVSEDALDHERSLGPPETREDAPEERQGGHKGVLVEGLHPGIDRAPEALIMRESDAGAATEPLKEACRVGHRRAWRQRAADERHGLIGGDSLALVGQPQRQPRHHRGGAPVARDSLERSLR